MKKPIKDHRIEIKGKFRYS